MAMSTLRYTAIDVETSGLSHLRGGRVIEVGAVVLECGVVINEFVSLIYTGVPIQYGAYRVHGISEEILAGEPVPKNVWRHFQEFVGAAPLIAHNAQFDRAFVLNEMGLLGVSLQNPWRCTLRLARQKLPRLQNHRLDTVYRYLFGELPKTAQRHRALDDARLVAQVWATLADGY